MNPTNLSYARRHLTEFSFCHHKPSTTIYAADVAAFTTATTAAVAAALAAATTPAAVAATTLGTALRLVD